MSYVEAVLLDNPKALWMLDPVAMVNGAAVKDYSPTADDASIVNAHGMTPVTGALLAQAVNRAMQEYVGDNGAVVAPDVAALRIAGNAVTIEVWAKSAAPSSSGYGYMYSKLDVTGQGTHGFTLRAWNGAQRLTFSFGDGAVSREAAYSATNVWDDAWHHIVVTWDGANLRWYIDGVLRETVPLSGGVIATTNPMRSSRMFADQGFAATDFQGAMQAMAIYDHVISADRVAVHYASALNNPYGLIEPIAKNIKAVLTPYLVTSRQRVEAARGLSAGTIPDFAEITLGPRQNHARYPALEIDGVDHPILTDAPDYLKSAFTIALIAIVTAPVGPGQTSDPEEDLTLLTWRMEAVLVDAVMRARDAHLFATDVGYGVDLQGERIDYSPTRFLGNDLFARDIFIPMVCTIEEVRS